MSHQPLFKTAAGKSGDQRRPARRLGTGSSSRLPGFFTCTRVFRLASPNPKLSRNELLAAIYQTLRGLATPTLCVPTFTFSFCNGEDYDTTRSKSRMGMLNEFIRRQPEAVRSVDPLMSVAVVGPDRDLAENLGQSDSVGKEIRPSIKLSRRTGVKFLFLGVRLGDCFTYMHYLEWIAGVSYRYDREFTGKITHAVENPQKTPTGSSSAITT